jgi:Clr5 domain
MNSYPLLDEAQVSLEQNAKTSRSVRNSAQKWESLKEEVRQIYIEQDSTLAITIQTIEAKHGLKAR